MVLDSTKGGLKKGKGGGDKIKCSFNTRATYHIAVRIREAFPVTLFLEEDVLTLNNWAGAVHNGQPKAQRKGFFQESENDRSSSFDGRGIHLVAGFLYS